MKRHVICFLLKDGEVLLGMKKKGHGTGKWNGFGGKVEEGEEPKAAAAREVKEETGIDVAQEDLRDLGMLTFSFKENPALDNTCAVFVADRWTGEPAESDEMKPSWFAVGDVPFEEMWLGDRHWIPPVLAGKKVNGRFLFDDRGGELLNFAVSTK